MINRELQSVTVITYASGTDSYGRPSITVESTRNVPMAVYLYSQKQVQDPRYNECEMLGLTKDTAITDKNVIQIGTTKYQVIHLIPSKRWNQILLKQLK